MIIKLMNLNTKEETIISSKTLTTTLKYLMKSFKKIPIESDEKWELQKAIEIFMFINKTPYDVELMKALKDVAHSSQGFNYKMSCIDELI